MKRLTAVDAVDTAIKFLVHIIQNCWTHVVFATEKAILQLADPVAWSTGAVLVKGTSSSVSNMSSRGWCQIA